jgi:hypothetical protein
VPPRIASSAEPVNGGMKTCRRKMIMSSPQRQAAEEIGQTERHIRRLPVKLKREGGQAVIYGGVESPALCGLTGRPAI